jgi:hypothetical protein
MLVSVTSKTRFGTTVATSLGARDELAQLVFVGLRDALGEHHVEGDDQVTKLARALGFGHACAQYMCVSENVRIVSPKTREGGREGERERASDKTQAA